MKDRGAGTVPGRAEGLGGAIVSRTEGPNARTSSPGPLCPSLHFDVPGEGYNAFPAFAQVSVHTHILIKHYMIKASKARSTSNAIFGLKHGIGSLPVREGLQLYYMAHANCYLISGCELALDTDMAMLHQSSAHVSLSGQIPVRIWCLLRSAGWSIGILYTTNYDSSGSGSRRRQREDSWTTAASSLSPSSHVLAPTANVPLMTVAYN
ncbi:hypothetical protein B0H12DRAFT_1298092 [Mycena haematopus]|nr:hypothetical protein B0H12DRAFT_1298092 [Mycena haematopus]